MTMLLVHLDEPGPRQRYIISHLLERMLGWPVRFSSGAAEFSGHVGPRLRYGAPVAGDEAFTVVPALKLSEVRTGMRLPVPQLLADMPVLFPTEHGHDPFAGAFVLLALVDEMGEHERDQHGRVKSDDLHLVRHGSAQQPLVDRWALELAGRLRERFPELPPPTRQFRHVVTVDVDNGLRYVGHPLHRQWAAGLRDLALGRIGSARDRAQVLLGNRPDPFDRYDELGDILHSDKADRVIAFLLMRGRGAQDHACSHLHPRFQARVRSMHRAIEVGLHPSYTSSTDPQVAAEDRARLESIIAEPVSLSRQHFLRWCLPDTLRELESAGFHEDHTLGFSDRTGFRAGTCTPFPYYDLEQDRATTLMLWPFATMDSALHDRMGLAPAAAQEQIDAVIDTVRAVQGTFVSVWHDRFLSDHGPWKGWRAVLLNTLSHARR